MSAELVSGWFFNNFHVQLSAIHASVLRWSLSCRQTSWSFPCFCRYAFLCLLSLIANYRLFIFYRMNGSLTFQRHGNRALTFSNLCSLFTFHTKLSEPIEREISLSNKSTLSQSDLIGMFFISYDVCDRCFCFLKAK